MVKKVRVMLTLTEEQRNIIRSVKGFGTADAEICKGIILAWLAEKSFIANASK